MPRGHYRSVPANTAGEDALELDGCDVHALRWRRRRLDTEMLGEGANERSELAAVSLGEFVGGLLGTSLSGCFVG